MKKILVPYDFSECSEHALNQAVYLAELWGAHLHLFHVAALHPYWRDLSVNDLEQYQANLKIALKIEAKLKAKADAIASDKITVIHRYSPGPIIEKIVQYAKDGAMDLIVMGTHGASGIQELMIGSNAQKILRLVPCPVLAIKHDLVYREFNQIAFVSDFRSSAMSAFENAMEMAELFNGELYLINMDEPGFFSDPLLAVRKSMREFEAVAKARGIKCHIRRLPAGDLEENLKKEIRSSGIDLLVLPTRGKGGMVRLFFDSLAEGIVNHLDKPIMTVKI